MSSISSIRPRAGSGRRRDAGGPLLLGAQLLVRGGGRVDHQALGVADVGQVREQLQRFDERLARPRSPPLMPNVSTPPRPSGRYFCASA